MKRLICSAVVMFGAFGAPAIAAIPVKAPLTHRLDVRLVAQPGEVVRWQSPRIGSVQRLTVRVNGEPAIYRVVPRTNNCVAYIYGEGLVARMTDCVVGRRVPYVRVRVVSASVRTSTLWLRFN